MTGYKSKKEIIEALDNKTSLEMLKEIINRVDVTLMKMTSNINRIDENLKSIQELIKKRRG